jgi:O-acetylserine/cysteine efflux transporter
MASAMSDPAHQERFGSLDIAVVAVMNIMWGLNLIAVKIAVDAVSPMTAALLRQVIVMCVCLPFLKIIPGRMRELTALGFLSGALFYVFVNWSLAVADNVSALAIAGQLGAPFSLILAVLVLKERIHAYRIIGMALSFFGVMLLVFDPAIAHEMPGMLLTVVASVIWAICSLIQRRLRGTPVMTIYAWVGLVGSLSLLPIAWVIEPEQLASVGSLPLSSLGWISFSAIGSTVIGQGAMSWLMQRHPVSVVVPLTLPTPVISVIASTLYFNTPLTPVMMLGGVIVLIGVGIVTIRTARAREGAD